MGRKGNAIWNGVGQTKPEIPRKKERHLHGAALLIASWVTGQLTRASSHRAHFFFAAVFFAAGFSAFFAGAAAGFAAFFAGAAAAFARLATAL